MKNLKSHFKFTKQEQRGIFYLLLLLVIIQFVFLLFHTWQEPKVAAIHLDSRVQEKINELKARESLRNSIKIFPFNPNYITDFKGYALGMSVEEIDRLLAFRSKGAFVNSAAEFQEVTKVSDSLLKAISPYFKFPRWTQNTKNKDEVVLKAHAKATDPVDVVIVDLNKATAAQLKQIKGVGEVLSSRIVKFRDRLGGFLVEDQLYEVYGLDKEVADVVLTRFKIVSRPNIEKININTASVSELSKLLYIQKHVAQNIVNYRNAKGSIDSFDELAKIEDFPTERIDRIALYLSLKN